MLRSRETLCRGTLCLGAMQPYPNPHLRATELLQFRGSGCDCMLLLPPFPIIQSLPQPPVLVTTVVEAMAQPCSGVQKRQPGIRVIQSALFVDVRGGHKGAPGGGNTLNQEIPCPKPLGSGR